MRRLICFTFVRRWLLCLVINWFFLFIINLLIRNLAINWTMTKFVTSITLDIWFIRLKILMWMVILLSITPSVVIVAPPASKVSSTSTYDIISTSGIFNLWFTLLLCMAHNFYIWIRKKLFLPKILFSFCNFIH